MTQFWYAITKAYPAEKGQENKAYLTIFSVEKYTKLRKFSQRLKYEQIVAIIHSRLVLQAKNEEEDILCSKNQ